MTHTISTASKPILCIDFDGVIHSYDKGWQNGLIYGIVTDGFFQWAWEAKDYFALCIYSSRSSVKADRLKMEQWLVNQHGLWADRHHGPMDYPKWSAFGFTFSAEKPPAFLTIDDRALRFTGKWSDFKVDKLRTFKPWNAK